MRSLITNFPWCSKCAILDIFYLLLSRSWLKHLFHSFCLSHGYGLILNRHICVCAMQTMGININMQLWLCMYKIYRYSNHRRLAFWIAEESETYVIKESSEINFKWWKNNSEEHLLEHTAWQDVQYCAIIIHLGCSMGHEAKRHI